MTSLSLPKVSELMRPLERAKLVISLELKGAGEVGADSTISTEDEIKQVVAACPNSQVRDYNFFIALKDRAWKLMIMIELNQSYLETLEGRMSLFRYLLVISPTLNDCLQTVKSKQAEGVDREWEALIAQLESLTQLRTDKEELVLANQELELILGGFKKRFCEIVGEINGYIEVIKRLEHKYFEDMEIVSRDSKHPTGVIPRVGNVISKVVETHNRELQGVVDGFNLLNMDLGVYRLGKLNEFMLEDSHKVDNDWVEKKLTENVEEART
jgi:hypothetical protein